MSQIAKQKRGHLKFHHLLAKPFFENFIWYIKWCIYIYIIYYNIYIHINSNIFFTFQVTVFYKTFLSSRKVVVLSLVVGRTFSYKVVRWYIKISRFFILVPWLLWSINIYNIYYIYINIYIYINKELYKSKELFYL